MAQAAAGARVAVAQSGVAEQRFEAGVADLKAGRFETACAAIEASYVAEARLGTLLALAACLEKWGKSYSAALRYEQYIDSAAGLTEAELAQRAAQIEYASQALVRVRRQIVYLIVVAPEPVAEVSGIALDQRALPVTPEQTLPLDPGPHTLETQGEGRAPWQLAFDVAPGESRRVQLELGAAQPPATTPLPVPPAPDAVVAATGAEQVGPMRLSSAPPTMPLPAPDESPWRNIGWGLGAAGIASVGAGVVAGLLVLDACPGLRCSDGDRDRVKTLAVVTDIGFAVGLTSLAASAIILLETTPQPGRSDATAVQPVLVAGQEGAWLGLSRRW
jgi:hypothetical protein